ncbi:histamine H3 receptor-like [Haliotis cracherodii]|uniref:histamine H3 receptor-like n=1 Tax=Haliotis cracherodii TaxID=6455 RepID=UPI0039E83D90
MSSTSLSPATEAEEEESTLLPLNALIPAIICITGMIIVAVGGNMLIIISYIRDKQLQTVHNMYLLNLAVTDLLLGCISMPFYAVYTITNWHWPFGTGFCKFFMFVDFALCLESVLLIIVISLDRLILVTKGAAYVSEETFKVGHIKVGLSWLLALSLYGPAIIGWDYWAGESTVGPGDCDVEFAYNSEFTLATSLIEFAVPFLSISVLNTLIYIKIRKRTKIFAKKTNSLDIHTTTIRKDMKAAKALALLVLALAVCWAPYTISTIIIAFCDSCINSDVYEVLNWLLWFKSCINPFLYALNSARFAHNIKKLLACTRR